ncbi:hypothetical protein QFC24_004006 [Naganishia onofrii]|uniref:Uncharacterized protein n=1 Tax=Naganishia onofrii TaxID=1851511 RepID=A0ACC2XGL1_9TREE|nr:hypothetical protein QFC24_004006 [Naganishia onofrii]
MRARREEQRLAYERGVPFFMVGAQQKAQETAMLASQSAGKRKNIDFTTSTSSGRNSKRRDPAVSGATGNYAPSSVIPRHLSAEAAENKTRSGERERSKRDSRSAGREAGSSGSGSRRRERQQNDGSGGGGVGYSVNTGEGVSRRYERDRQDEREGGKRSLQSRRWD